MAARALGLGGTLRADRGGLGLALDTDRVGERGAVCLLILTGQPRPLGVRLGLLDQAIRRASASCSAW